MIIGVSGRIGSGKDTVASWLVRERGFMILRFSDALKEEVLTKFRRTVAALWRLHWRNDPNDTDLRWLVYESKPLGVRELLQEMGTDVRRADDLDYWVKRWRQTLVRWTGSDHDLHIVTPDVRFLNEVMVIQQAGGVVWHITRPAIRRDVVAHHVSETGLDAFTGWDLVLDNDGTIDDLVQKLAKIIP